MLDENKDCCNKNILRKQKRNPSNLKPLLLSENSISNSNTYISYDGKQKRNFPVAAVIETAEPFQSQEILRPRLKI